MKVYFQHKDYVITAVGSVIAAVSVYWVLSVLLVTPRITIPISIIIFTLTFGLTRYYDNLHTDLNRRNNANSIQDDSQGQEILGKVGKEKNSNITAFSLATIFSFLILISYFANHNDSQIFINWNSIEALGILQLAVGIMLCFFIPGYAVILIISKKYNFDPIFSVIAGYLLSILMTGLTAYVSALLFDSAISKSKDLFIVLYLIILASFLICYPQYKSTVTVRLQFRNYFCYQSAFSVIKELRKYVTTKASELVVFASLFSLIITSTYVLFGGHTIGDQWFHQGRSLLFMSGSFREAAISHGEIFYPPFQSAVLAALSTLSGVPIVNSYASIAFLNAVPMFAFYYFFMRWIPAMSKAGLLACSLFTLSSGFGWIYLLSTFGSFNITSEDSSLGALRTIGHLDIVSASNFVIPTAPDFSTGLIYIALPAGIILLVLVRSRFSSFIINVSLLVTVTVLGIISHYEFYIFIIIASLLPVIFKMKRRNYVYAGLLISISIVYLLNSITPGNYFISLRILGYPLLLLVAIFVLISWTFYLVSKIKFLASRVNLSNSLNQIRQYVNNQNHSAKFIIRIAITLVVAYLYLLSFLVLGDLSLDTVRDHTSYSKVPWYLYPMKLGIAGVLGLAFILSMLFRKFEKEALVFGVIIVIAIFTGPYYSESRFSKYVMIGMVGFASLMLYRILLWRFGVSTFRNTAIIGTIVVCSGLSILMFIGYNSLILQTQDFINTLPRRHFPSMAELNLFETLYRKVDINSNKYNIVSLPSEYNRWEDGLMSKVHSFAGLPYDKIRQSPLTLNASTLDSLYRHLSFSDTGYIILPKHDIDGPLSEPTHFAIDHFNQVYQDNDYLVLETPVFAPPTPTSSTTEVAEVGLVYNEKHDILFPSTESMKILQYDNKSFNLKKNDEIATGKKESQNQTLELIGSNRQNSTTLWSKNIASDPIVNSFETRLRVIFTDENENNNYVGLKWREGDSEYFVKLLSSGLELYERTMNNQQYKIVTNNSEIEKMDSIWYKVNVESMSNLISIYIDEVPIIKVAKPNYKNSQGITRIGLSSFHNNVEFEPIKIWNISESQSSQVFNNKTKYFDYFYPLSILALSKTKYDIFRMGDLSVLSKDVVIVADDEALMDNDLTSTYLEYVRSGGTLVVVNSDNNFNRTLANFYSIQSNQSMEESFSGITLNRHQNLTVNVHGVVKGIEFKSPPELNITASYRNNNNESVAPFAIEKNFSKGKIVLLNAGAYFNALSNLPKQYFYSLSKISHLLPINGNTATDSKNTSIPMKGIIGNMEASGKITLNSSSFTLLEEGDHPYILDATKITISNETSNSSVTLNNTTIKNLKLNGRYNVEINLTGMVKLPGMNSERNYFSLFIPNNFDMAVRLYPEASISMKIFSTSKNVTSSVEVNNNSLIQFRDIKASGPLKHTAVLMKSPELTVHGNTSISNANFNGYLTDRGALDVGVKLGIQGTVQAKFNFVDHYHEHYKNATKIKYISYLDSVEMYPITHPKQESLRLPGGISSSATENGQGIPLMKIISSTVNIVILMVLVLITVIAIWLTKHFKSRAIKAK